MTTPWRPPDAGALDDTEWPTTLVAKAVEPSPDDDRVHGYAIVDDVARHYSFSDALYLAITGELPDDRSSRLFHFALCSFAAMATNEAPTHVAVLSRICGGDVSSAIAAGSVTLADQARYFVKCHSALLEWLAQPNGEPAEAYRSSDSVEWIRRLRAASGCESLHLRDDLTRDAAKLVLLYESGLTQPAQLEAAIYAGRLPGMFAEMLAASPQDLGRYPVKLPPFHYVEGT